VVLGAMAGYLRGLVDGAISRLIDLMLCVPSVVITAVLARRTFSVLPSAQNSSNWLTVALIIALFTSWFPIARTMRGMVLSLREKEFVEAARALGASRVRLVLRHILPNAIGPVIVAGTIEVANAIIAESTLSFLGLGFPPDIPTWGRILYDAKDYLDIAPHWALFPGAAIFLAVLSINFIGDGLRDALDPRRVL
jgi:peptide/nickel transport system permease protein